MWLSKDVSDDLLRAIYDLAKWGPTSANLSPARFVFVKSEDAKAKLISTLDAGNVDKVKAAPVTAIVAEDRRFWEKGATLFPSHFAAIKDYFDGNLPRIETTAFRNSTLQGAYLMLAARALGLDCGPMSGFDNQKLDALFFKDTDWKSNFICNLGYGDHSKLFPRLPRLDFDEACEIA